MGPGGGGLGSKAAALLVLAKTMPDERFSRLLYHLHDMADVPEGLRRVKRVYRSTRSGKRSPDQRLRYLLILQRSFRLMEKFEGIQVI